MIGIAPFGTVIEKGWLNLSFILKIINETSSYQSNGNLYCACFNEHTAQYNQQYKPKLGN